MPVAWLPAIPAATVSTTTIASTFTATIRPWLCLMDSERSSFVVLPAESLDGSLVLEKVTVA